MRWLTRLIARRKAKDALVVSLKPSPDLIRRREAQLPPDRVARWRGKRVLQ